MDNSSFEKEVEEIKFKADSQPRPYMITSINTQTATHITRTDALSKNFFSNIYRLPELVSNKVFDYITTPEVKNEPVDYEYQALFNLLKIPAALAVMAFLLAISTTVFNSQQQNINLTNGETFEQGLEHYSAIPELPPILKEDNTLSPILPYLTLQKENNNPLKNTSVNSSIDKKDNIPVKYMTIWNNEVLSKIQEQQQEIKEIIKENHQKLN